MSNAEKVRVARFGQYVVGQYISKGTVLVTCYLRLPVSRPPRIEMSTLDQTH